MKKIYIGLLVLLIATVSLVGCTEPASTQDTIKVGFIGPLSGDGASFGKDNLVGIQVAVDDINKVGGINGKKVELLIEDDKLDEKITLNAYHKMRSVDDIDVLLSPNYGGLLAIVDQADATQHVIVNSLDTSEELAAAGEYLFAIGIHDENIGYELAHFTMDTLKKRRVAVLYNFDPITDLISGAFVRKFQEIGGHVVINEGYIDGSHDFRSVLLKAKSQGVDTLVVFGFDESGFIFKQEMELGLGMTKLAFDTVTSESFLANAGESADGIYFTSWDATGSKYQSLQRKVVAKSGSAPDQPLFTAVGYDAMITVAQAMKTGSRGKALHDSLLQVGGMEGVAGEITMSPDGIVRTVSEEMYQIQDGKFVKLR